MSELWKAHSVEFDGWWVNSKCLKYVPGKKTTIGDKPATRRREVTHGLDIARMPMARGVETVNEYEVQRAAVSGIRIST